MAEAPLGKNDHQGKSTTLEPLQVGSPTVWGEWATPTRTGTQHLTHHSEAPACLGNAWAKTESEDVSEALGDDFHSPHLPSLHQSKPQHAGLRQEERQQSAADHALSTMPIIEKKYASTKYEEEKSDRKERNKVQSKRNIQEVVNENGHEMHFDPMDEDKYGKMMKKRTVTPQIKSHNLRPSTLR